MVPRAEAQGFVQSQFSIGMLYFNGQGGLPRDYEKAIEWYKKAAKEDFLPALYCLGYMCEKGFGCEPDSNEALQWYQKAAAAGDGQSRYRIAMMHLNGSMDMKKDPDKAFQMCQQAIGEGSSEAVFGLGVMYENGQGSIPRDFDKAVALYQQAADAGYPKALSRLGILYDNGLGVERDLAEAAKWHQKAAMRGNVYSQNRFCRDVL